MHLLNLLVPFQVLLALHVSALPPSTSNFNNDVSLGTFGRCGRDPGAICGILGMTCVGAIKDPDARTVWRGVSCTSAAIWCTAQFSVNQLVCARAIEWVGRGSGPLRLPDRKESQDVESSIGSVKSNVCEELVKDACEADTDYWIYLKLWCPFESHVPIGESYQCTMCCQPLELYRMNICVSKGDSHPRISMRFISRLLMAEHPKPSRWYENPATILVIEKPEPQTLFLAMIYVQNGRIDEHPCTPEFWSRLGDGH